jgi:hypothetical protein
MGGILIWIIVPALVVGNISRAKRVGFDEYSESFSRGFAWVRESFASLGETGLPILLGGAALALVIVALFRNNLLGLVLFGCMVSAIGSQSESFWFFFLRLAWNDIQRNLGRGDNLQKPFNMAVACVGTAGAALGLLLGFILPGIRRYGLAGFVAALILVGIIAAWYSSRKTGRQPPAMLLLVMLLALTATLAVALPVYADDGGWKEAGGTFGDWVRSEGAGRAIFRGFLPGVGFVVGYIVGGVVGGQVGSYIGGKVGAISEERPEPWTIPGITPTEAATRILDKYGDIIPDQRKANLGRHAFKVLDHDDFQKHCLALHNGVSEVCADKAAFPVENRRTGKLSVLIDRDRSGGAVATHELFHLASNPNISKDFGHHLNEGVTQYFTRQFTDPEGIRSEAYISQRMVIKEIVSKLNSVGEGGEELLRRAYFGEGKEEVNALVEAVDTACGEGAMDKIIKLMEEKRWSDAVMVVRKGIEWFEYREQRSPLG